MSPRSFPLFAVLVGLFASGTVCADPIVMTIDNYVIYIGDQIDQKETARVRAEIVGSKATLEFFSQGDILRLTFSNQKKSGVCERTHKSFSEETYRCSDDGPNDAKPTLTLKTVGPYIRSGILTGPVWGKRTATIELTR